MVQLTHLYVTTGKTIALTIWTSVGKVMSLILNMLSRFAMGFPDVAVVKNPPTNAGDRVQALGQEDALEQEVATYSSILAWRMPWAEEPDGLQSLGLHRVEHD